MAVQRKVFRIEQTSPAGVTTDMLDRAAISAADAHEILAELKALHERMERRHPGVDITPSQADELQQLKSDTDAIHLALNRTKQEIASLHVNAFWPPPARMVRELDAVAESAERATQQILSAAEQIEDAATSLTASLGREQERMLALDIQDNILRIFEACNFQDLTGQRIAKVLATLKFIEERVAHMVEIWGGMEALKSYTAEADLNRDPMLHGPRLDDDNDHVSQDDVDALFAD
jgi:chemotaxis protein CheZ